LAAPVLVQFRVWSKAERYPPSADKGRVTDTAKVAERIYVDVEGARASAIAGARRCSRSSAAVASCVLKMRGCITIVNEMEF
jgi:hypothetical protein